MSLWYLHWKDNPNTVFLGHISSLGSTSCTVCRAGYECPDVDDPTTSVPCSAGSYSEELDLVCHQCPSGSRCPYTTYVTLCNCYINIY